VSLDLLKERFGGNKSTDKKESDKQKLNEMFISKPAGDIKSFKAQYQDELAEKDRVIENLKQELNSQWLTNQTAFNTKKMYEDKIKKMDIVDSTNLIPTLIEVSKQKQGDVKLDWMSWLEIPESNYLFQINESLAKKVFQENNLLIDRLRYKQRGGIAPVDINYILSFTGDTNVSTRRGDLVATDFQPHNYDGAGSSIGTDGFTISFWLRPDEIVTDGFAIGFKSGAHDRFEFGMKNNEKIFFGVASNETKLSWKEMNDAVVGENANDGFTESEMNELFDGGTDWKTDGTWYHIAVSYVGHAGASAGDRYRRIYLNGRQLRGEGVGPAANDGDFNWDTSNRKIIDEGLSFGMRAVKGSGTTVSYNNGLACGLDEVAIYKGVKDSDFIRNVYNGGTGYNHTGVSNLIAYWKFNEGSGTRLEDFGPYGYHGLLTNDSHGNDGGAAFASGVPTWEEIKGY
jgi:hypothetical protein